MGDTVSVKEMMVWVEALQADKASPYPKRVDSNKGELLCCPRCGSLDVDRLPPCGWLASLRNGGRLRAQ